MFDESWMLRHVYWHRLFRSHDKGLQRLPRRILLGFELLSAAVMRIAASLLGKRVMDDRAVHAAGDGDLLDELEVLT